MAALYRPISATEFRVVHLLPGTFDDEIRCVLETRPPNVKTRYKALSYQWGDASITKPIRIARLDAPHQKALLKDPPAPIRREPSLLRERLSSLRAVLKKYNQALRFLGWCIGTYASHRVLSRSILEGLYETPEWASWLVCEEVYILLLSMMVGFALVNYTVGASELLSEVARTKPWSLVSDFKVEDHGELEFCTMGVTTNLELALRYIRQEKRTVTLWIDALCINQGDEDEKQVQVQRMDWVYANASPVVIWLGGYHGTRETQGCREGDDCQHKRQMQAAFDLIWTLSGWRVLVPPRFKGYKKKMYPGALPGISELQRRGWWERLWVVQEVALATGPVQMQCGHNVCELGNFWSAHYVVRQDNHSDEAVILGSQAAENFRLVVQDFRFSDWEDQPESHMAIAELLYMITTKVFFLFGCDIHENKIGFRHQGFPARIERILLRTAGRFKCQEDRDRFFAVFGIAMGSRAERNTKTRDLIRFTSANSTASLVTHAFDPLYKGLSTAYKAVSIALSLSYGLWTIFYDSHAKHWTISRPEYVVTDSSERRADLVRRLKPGTSRAEFFTILASYLATKTETLAFLDAANCGDDKDGEMPSWVPTWAREVSESAYTFAIRMNRNGQAKDRFSFTESGKVLALLGYPRGTVHVVRSVADSISPRPLPHRIAFERWLALSKDSKTGMSQMLEALASFRLRTKELRHSLGSEPRVPGDAKEKLDEMERQVTLLATKRLSEFLDIGEERIREGGTTLVYSLDKRAREMGFLKAGEAAKGDRIVLVPGCYHHLVLRRQSGIDDKWKLVGLVEMGEPDSRMKGYSEPEWTQLVKMKKVFKYLIA